MIRLILGLYSLVVLANTIITWIRIPASKWTELLRSVVDPALDVTRKLMKRYLPGLCGKGIDWSPVVLFVALHVISWLLGWII